MRYAIGVTLTTCLIFGGEWLYRSFLRPIDPLTSDVKSLAEHFSNSGIDVRPYAVRHTFRHSKVLAVAAFQIEGFRFPVLVTQTPSEAEAAVQIAQLVSQSANLPSSLQPARRGTLIMTLSFWDDDTERMATKVQQAFATFNYGI